VTLIYLNYLEIYFYSYHFMALRFEDVMTVTTSMCFFWVVRPCGHVGTYQRFLRVEGGSSTFLRNVVISLQVHVLLLTEKPSISYGFVRFQVLTTASMKFRFVFWDVLPCKIIIDRRFRGTCCLHHQGDLIDNYFTRQYIPEDKSELHLMVLLVIVVS
jgi:hypothetical protein